MSEVAHPGSLTAWKLVDAPYPLRHPTNRQIKDWAMLILQIQSHLLFCCSLGKSHMCGIYSNLCTKKKRLGHKVYSRSMVYILCINPLNIKKNKINKGLFASAAAFNFMLMYRFESSRSPTCKDTQHHFACLYDCIHAGAKLANKTSTKWALHVLYLPVKLLDQVWSWGPEASSAPHPSSDAPWPAWEHNTTE